MRKYLINDWIKRFVIANKLMHQIAETDGKKI